MGVQKRQSLLHRLRGESERAVPLFTSGYRLENHITGRSLPEGLYLGRDMAQHTDLGGDFK